MKALLISTSMLAHKINDTVNMHILYKFTWTKTILYRGEERVSSFLLSRQHSNFTFGHYMIVILVVFGTKVVTPSRAGGAKFPLIGRRVTSEESACMFR